MQGGISWLNRQNLKLSVDGGECAELMQKGYHCKASHPPTTTDKIGEGGCVLLPRPDGNVVCV